MPKGVRILFKIFVFIEKSFAFVCRYLFAIRLQKTKYFGKALSSPVCSAKQSDLTDICAMCASSFNPLVPDAHHSEHSDKLTSSQKQTIRKELMINWRIFIFCTPGTNGLTAMCLFLINSPKFFKKCIDCTIVDNNPTQSSCLNLELSLEWRANYMYHTLK